MIGIKKLVNWIAFILYGVVGLLIMEKAFNYDFNLIDAIATIAYIYIVSIIDWDKVIEGMTK
jgi:hypothetical protein